MKAVVYPFLILLSVINYSISYGQFVASPACLSQYPSSQRLEIIDIFDNYWNELIELQTLKESSQEIINLNKSCIDQIGEVCGTDQSLFIFEQLSIEKIMDFEVTKNFVLSDQDARKFATLKYHHTDQCTKIRSQYPYGDERKTRIKDVNNKFEQDVKELVGQEKYNQWQRYKTQNFDRIHKGRYGFNDLQLKMYKEMLNKEAIEIQKVKMSSNSQDEKKVIISRIRANLNEHMSAILDREQYDKWIESRPK